MSLGRPLLVPATLLLVLVAACGSANEKGQTAPEASTTVTVTAAPTPPESPSPRVQQPRLPPEVTGAMTVRRQVSSPTGNIWCAMEYGVECVIMENDYPALPRPGYCDVDWIDASFIIGESKGERGVCRGDTPFDEGQPTTLPYGSTGVWKGNACQSTEGGMICWNTKARHGFRIARADYDLF